MQNQTIYQSDNLIHQSVKVNKNWTMTLKV